MVEGAADWTVSPHLSINGYRRPHAGRRRRRRDVRRHAPALQLRRDGRLVLTRRGMRPPEAETDGKRERGSYEIGCGAVHRRWQAWAWRHPVPERVRGRTPTWRRGGAGARKTAVLTDAPNVPPPITRTHADQGHRQARGPGGRQAPGRRRRLHVLDVRRIGARASSSASARATRSSSTSATTRRARCRTTSTCTRSPGPGGGAAASFTAPGPHVDVLVQGAQPRPLRLPLRHGAGRHAHRQRHVRPDPRRAERGPAARSTASTT